MYKCLFRKSIVKPFRDIRTSSRWLILLKVRDLRCLDMLIWIICCYILILFKHQTAAAGIQITTLHLTSIRRGIKPWFLNELLLNLLLIVVDLEWSQITWKKWCRRIRILILLIVQVGWMTTETCPCHLLLLLEKACHERVLHRLWWIEGIRITINRVCGIWPSKTVGWTTIVSRIIKGRRSHKE